MDLVALCGVVNAVSRSKVDPRLRNTSSDRPYISKVSIFHLVDLHTDSVTGHLVEIIQPFLNGDSIGVIMASREFVMLINQSKRERHVCDF